MTHELGHLDIVARHYADDRDLTVDEIDMPRLTAYGYALAWYPKYFDPETDDPDFSKKAVYYIIVDLPSGHKHVEIALTVEQLSEALLDTVRAHNHPNEVDRVQLVEEWQAMTEGVRTFGARVKSVSSLASAAALFVSGVSAFRFRRALIPLYPARVHWRFLPCPVP